MELTDKRYSKLLISKYSPANGCNVEDGAILTVTPKADVKKKDHIPYYFVDSLDKTTKSKYGWVKTVESFTLKDFLDKNCSNQREEREAEHITTMLESISNLADDTPVAATYSERGLEDKKMVFTVHKVFFYKKPLV
jgi:hypothetical protein